MFYLFFITTTFLLGINAILYNGFYSKKFARFIHYGEFSILVGIIFILLSVYFSYLFFKSFEKNT